MVCRLLLPSLALVGSVLVAGGNCEQVKLQCTADRDCDPQGLGFSICNVGDGTCRCTDDRGCGDDEVCNSLGRCQAESGCNSNDDCNSGLFCDVTTSQCLAVDECAPALGERCCVLDSQCGFNSVCDPLAKKCIPGCRDEGDCILGQACVRGLGQPLGQCAAGVCSRDNLCGFGQICNSEGACVNDTRGPYCLGCAGGVASDDCGARGNFCLTDSVNGGEFCGVGCVDGQACPFGYTCSDVIIIPPAAPFCSGEICVIESGRATGRCALNSGVVCSRDADCPIGFPGGDCPRGTVGNCRRNQLQACSNDAECGDGDECVKQECRFGEGDAFGYCSCTRDSDCPRDRCVNVDPVSGLGDCELSGRNCFNDAECDAVISCIDGGCFIGRNCAPQDGRTCRDFLPAQ
jgi:hypothetical protein